MSRLLLITFVCIGMVLLISCEGPAGPAGPAGADGGVGADGTDGADGALFCLGCHDQGAMDDKAVQFAEAGHSTAYTRFTSTTCAPCHSHQGFIQYGEGGQVDLDFIFDYGSTMTCGTCHSHKLNGSPAVFDTTEGWVPIRFNDPVILRTGEPDLDFGNNDNLCVRCHQPRRNWAEYDDETGDSVKVTSSHAGPHHGAQSTTLMGLGGDHRLTSISDASLLGPSTHGTGAGCVACHMYERNHTFAPAVETCEACHSSVPTDFDYNGVKTSIAAKMTTLAGLLSAIEGQGIGRDSDGVYQVIADSTVHGIVHEEEGEFHPVVGQFDRTAYSAFWNYMTVMEDQSGGIHNPAYVNALLDNAIDAIQ